MTRGPTVYVVGEWNSKCKSCGYCNWRPPWFTYVFSTKTRAKNYIHDRIKDEWNEYSKGARAEYDHNPQRFFRSRRQHFTIYHQTIDGIVIGS